MLSKKQARAFFLGGTIVTFLIFIGLTVFSLSEGNDQTNSENFMELKKAHVFWKISLSAYLVLFIATILLII